MFGQPGQQLGSRQPGGRPRQLPQRAVPTGRHRQHGDGQPVTRLQGLIRVHIDQLQGLGGIQGPELLLQPLTEAAALAREQQQLEHQSGTGSQPQGVKGWQRPIRFKVSQPPRQGPWRPIASSP